jgi:hypothetical protein
MQKKQHGSREEKNADLVFSLTSEESEISDLV